MVGYLRKSPFRALFNFLALLWSQAQQCHKSLQPLPACRLRSMRRASITLILLLLLVHGNLLEARRVGSDCMYKGKKLWGRIKVVTAFPDLRVKVVSSLPDLRVKLVDAFPDSCGKWQMVESFPDLKVQFVDSFPDITIEYVTAFPGVR